MGDNFEEEEAEVEEGREVHRSRIDSRGSGVSPRYFKVVEGKGAIVLLSLLKLFRGVLRLLRDAWPDICRIMTTPSSDEDSSSTTGQSSSPSLASTAMHCTTSLLKWICRRSLGEVIPEDEVVVRVPLSE